MAICLKHQTKQIISMNRNIHKINKHANVYTSGKSLRLHCLHKLDNIIKLLDTYLLRGELYLNVNGEICYVVRFEEVGFPGRLQVSSASVGVIS